MIEHRKRLVFTSGIDGAVNFVLGPLISEADVRRVLLAMLRSWPAAYSAHRKWVSEGALSAPLYDEPRIDVWIIPLSSVDAFDTNPERYVDTIPSIQALSLDCAQSFCEIIEFWNNHTRSGSHIVRAGES